MKKIIKQNNTFPRDTSFLLNKIPVFTGDKFIFLEPKNSKISKKEFIYILLTTFKQVITKQSRTEKKMKTLEQIIVNLNDEELSFIKQELNSLKNNALAIDIFDANNIKDNFYEFEKSIDYLIKKFEFKIIKLRLYQKYTQLKLFDETEIKKDYYVLI